MKSIPRGALCFVATVAMFGCGGGGTYSEDVVTGTVQGTVLYNGNPVPEGCIVTFLSEGGTGVPASATTSAGGSFTLRAKGTLEVPTGIYKVTVRPPAGPEMSAEEAMRASVAGNLPDYDVKEVPEKYRAPETTPEIFEVKEGSNTYELDMKAG